MTCSRFVQAEQKYDSTAVWPYFYAGTMGLVQRDGIHRLRHEKRYSIQKDTICVALSDAGWMAGSQVALTGVYLCLAGATLNDINPIAST